MSTDQLMITTRHFTFEMFYTPLVFMPLLPCIGERGNVHPSQYLRRLQHAAAAQLYWSLSVSDDRFRLIDHTLVKLL